MWTSKSEQLADGRGLRFTIEVDSGAVSYAQVMRLWQDDTEFRSMFIGLLAESPFSAFRWETPPITAATADRPFEFVIIDSPGLASRADVHAFGEYFRGGGKDGVVTFQNLGKDAVLVVPCPNGPASAYGHLGAFVRHAPDRQKHALWQSVGAAMQRRLSAKPVWLSTAGAGVSWLHVRLDDRPKYYHHVPYRSVP